MYDVDKQRRTGRTTRMLNEALKISAQGNAVYVVGDSAHHAIRLRHQFIGMNPPQGHGIKFENANQLPELDWQTLQLRGAHPNCIVLVDHYAIERRYAHVLEMLCRFDQPETEPGTETTSGALHKK